MSNLRVDVRKALLQPLLGRNTSVLHVFKVLSQVLLLLRMLKNAWYYLAVDVFLDLSCNNCIFCYCLCHLFKLLVI